eukprot:MONOS_52.1-p1 / transcript=MONOS_52.1 / gene=MONOS_52 / organism=Monocercomonoides_exilis_PA203 / gene_product=endonuclease V / transcript_product=endonuclease V / location=Mono_scaffold00001:276870-278188(+) / protein_length=377 / sequence_SO=supercontig / SO=protein_coding / is_pseudo=false
MILKEHEELIKKWESIQKEISSRVVEFDSFNIFSIPESGLALREINQSEPHTSRSSESLVENSSSEKASSSSIPSSEADHQVPAIRYIGGVDVSFFKENEGRGMACVAVLEFPSFRLVYENVKEFELTVPYVSGYLAFREKDILEKMIADIKNTHPQFYPQIIFVDGNGLLHPRSSGLACHIGVETDLPTIGIGKTFLSMDGLRWNEEEYKSQFQKKGDWVRLVRYGKTIGASLRTNDKSIRPVFVSVGHKISIETAVRFVNDCCIYRLPEPIRAADQIGREFVRVQQQKEHPDSEKSKKRSSEKVGKMVWVGSAGEKEAREKKLKGSFYYWKPDKKGDEKEGDESKSEKEKEVCDKEMENENVVSTGSSKEEKKEE